MRSADSTFTLGFLLLCSAVGLASIGGVANAEDASPGDLERFLPNDGNSVYRAAGLFREWPAGRPKELWRAEIGLGKSAVVEARGNALTATETEEKQYAICLDPVTGATRWKTLLYPKPNRHFTKGPVTSPVCDGDRVYYIGYATKSDVWDMICPIVCLGSDGKVLWRVDEGLWGTEASTPLVVGDTFYVSTDNPERVVLAALDKMTGAVRWRLAAEESERGRELGAPSSLTYHVVDGIPQVIVATYGTKEILGVHAQTGQVMWRYPYPAPISIGLVSTPVAVGSRLFVCAGEGKGKDFSACLEMKAENGKITCREVYLSTELQANMFNTVAIYRDAVFGFGGNRTAGFLHCTDFPTGRLLWKQEGREWTNQQNLVVADGLIFALTAKNEMVLAEASREGYRELGRVDLKLDLERPQQPTIANGRLYIRGMDSVVCFQVGK